MPKESRKTPKAPQKQADKDEAALCLERGLDYLKETRDLMDNHLGKLGDFFEAWKTIHPDLYADFKLLQKLADFHTLHARVAWFRAMLEASDRELDKAHPCTVPGLDNAYEELVRHSRATGAKYKSLYSPGQAKERSDELQGLLKDRVDAEAAIIDLNRMAAISSLDFDDKEKRFVMSCRKSATGSPKGGLPPAFKNHMDIWKAYKGDSGGSGTLPLETPLNKLPPKASAGENFWSYMVDVFQSSDYNLQSKQQGLFIGIAAYARIISLTIGLVPRVRLECLRELQKQKALTDNFVDTFEENILPLHSFGADPWECKDILEECQRFRVFLRTNEPAWKAN